MEKMTLEAFRAKFNGAPLDDEEYAWAIVAHLADDLPVTKASQAYLDACTAFDAAVDAAGIERG